MANDDASLILFRSGRGDLDTAAAALSELGMSVRRRARKNGDVLTVGYSQGPQLRVVFLCEPFVREEAEELGEGTPHAAELSRCDVRFEILIDDLNGVLDETNTLIDVQLTLQDATSGFMFNTWNQELTGPEKNDA